MREDRVVLSRFFFFLLQFCFVFLNSNEGYFKMVDQTNQT